MASFAGVFIVENWLPLLGGLFVVLWVVFEVIGHRQNNHQPLRRRVFSRTTAAPKVDLTIEFEGFPERGRFANQNGAGIESVWIVDHTTPPPGGDRGVLDFELDLEYDGSRWHFDKHPFQQIYVSLDHRFRDGYFSIPWQIKKNLRRHLMFLERQPTLIPDEAWRNFTLRINEVDSGEWFEISEPGRYRWTWPSGSD